MNLTIIFNLLSALTYNEDTAGVYFLISSILVLVGLLLFVIVFVIVVEEGTLSKISLLFTTIAAISLINFVIAAVVETNERNDRYKRWLNSEVVETMYSRIYSIETSNQASGSGSQFVLGVTLGPVGVVGGGGDSSLSTESYYCFYYQTKLYDGSISYTQTKLKSNGIKLAVHKNTEITDYGTVVRVKPSGQTSIETIIYLPQNYITKNITTANY